MSPASIMSVFHLFCLFMAFSCTGCGEASTTSGPLKTTYIVHVHKTPEHVGSHREWHESFLPSSGAVNGEARLVHSYGNVFSGFAARLTEEELEAMRTMEGFVRAQPDEVRTIDTTHTPSFLGLHRGDAADSFWSEAEYGRGIIIGVLDTGIFPTHPSFDDEGMPPPPPKWKGRCDFNFNLSLCNNKLVGARSFVRGNLSESSPIDHIGHGTHVAGIAAGRFVKNASVLGSARGTVAGMAPEAHVAVYKVCNSSALCNTSNILAAFESAVNDGVDIISKSLTGSNHPFYDDFVSIASFEAVRKGVFVSHIAGNDGPTRGTVRNAEPWTLTVGASTMDRRIRAVVKLGNGMELEGESAYQPTNFSSSFLPLVYPLWCSNATSLEELDVRGKIVLCADYGPTGQIVKEAGGAAMIVHSLETYDTFANAYMIPASLVSYSDGSSIIDYLYSTSNPKATIVFEGTEIGGSNDPVVAGFSSTGPSSWTPGLLKPDIIGPGVNVLAAWHEPVGPFKVSPPFNLLSGTSMSCPHLSGIVALLKNAHPDWSPAMIKSAIMTTADVVNLNGTAIANNWDLNRANFYMMGAGHVNPVRAKNPGLVYDVRPIDYLAYLCALNYTDAQVSNFTQSTTNCSDLQQIDEYNLNYPSITVSIRTNQSKAIKRTATNVGAPNSTYMATVVPPPNLVVTVQPEELFFQDRGEEKSFTVDFSLTNGTQVPRTSSPAPLEGFLIWVSSDGDITVTSPISATLGPSPPQ